MNINKKKILVIVPSRSQGNEREKNVDRFIDAWKEEINKVKTLFPKS